MKIYNFIMSDMVIPELDSQEREDALKEMIDFLKRKDKIAKGKELYEKLIQRERLGSTAIKDGVAIPHCKIKGLKNPIVMLAISTRGVNFYSLDGKPSFIFFLVVSPAENPSLNLQILAAIAHLVRKANSLTKKILQAKNVTVILDIIREEEEKLNE